VFIGVLGAFAVTRGITRFIRHRSASGVEASGPIKDITIGGVHIHHQVFGISLMFVSGLLLVTTTPQDALLDVLALLFGIGTGLAFDEFALWLHLDDVYWGRQGRKSIDAVAWVLVISASARSFVDLLQVFETSDDLGEFSWLLWLLVAITVIPAVICLLKGKIVTAALGILYTSPSGSSARSGWPNRTRGGTDISTGRTPAAGPGRNAGSEWNTPLVGSGSGTLSAELPPRADLERNRFVSPFAPQELSLIHVATRSLVVKSDLSLILSRDVRDAPVPTLVRRPVEPPDMRGADRPGDRGPGSRSPPATRGPCPKVFLVNFRHGLAAAALLSVSVFTVACAAPTPGTASAGAAAVSSSVSSPSSTSPSTTSASSSAAPTSASSSSPSTTVDDSSVTFDPTVTVVVEPSGVDATTVVWLQNSCTDLGTLFGALFALPSVDENAPLEEFRTAYRDYYASLADTILEMTDRMTLLDPPNVDGGQALHDGYLTYLIGLADINAGGAIAIDAAPDAESIVAIVDQIDFETQQLGESDFGLADFQSADLQAAMAEVPACQDLLAS
jgi:hypothetical protein